MREIKFRAWISIEEWEGYFYPKTKPNDYIQFMLYQNGWGVVDCNDQWLDQEEFIIEQYTGLKDKNGVEIYEGDIVKVITNDVQRMKEENYWSIEWVDFMSYTGFRCYGKDRRFNIKLTQTVIVNNKLEVVGNIHENKDLLND